MSRQYGSFNTSYTNDCLGLRPMSLKRVAIADKEYFIYVQDSGVALFVTKSGKINYFANSQEARNWLELRELGKTPSAVPLVNNYQMVTLYGSVFRDAPYEAIEIWIEDGYCLLSDLDYIWYFTFDGITHSFTNPNEARDAFTFLTTDEPAFVF